MPRILSIRNIDLNLLPVLMALIEEESVTGASQRVHLSQSATSSALRRIRDTLKDPILIPNGKRMKLSPKARNIREELRGNLDSIASMLGSFVPIDIKEELVRVAISAPEHVIVAMPDLLRNVFNHQDEDIRMLLTEFRHQSVFEELRRNETDLAISSFGYVEPSLERQTLYTEGLNITMRKGHPAIESQKEGRISIAAMEHFGHVSVSHDDAADNSILALMLKKKGVERKIEFTIPSVFSLPTILRNSDLICLGTNRGLLQYQELTNFVHLRPPKELECDTFDVELVWRRDKGEDPILKKIRALITQVAEAMAPISEVADAVFTKSS